MSKVKHVFNIATSIFAGIGVLFVLVFIAMRFDLLNVRGSIDSRNEFFATSTELYAKQPCVDANKTVCAWNETPEWETVREGLRKDASLMTSVGASLGVPARVIAASAVPEQIRFFTAEREVYKRYFEPLKILGSLSQFSLGITGIKQETARQAESFAADPDSPFYTGATALTLIEYASTTTDKDAELFKRLTDDKNHYYSYLYTALILSQLNTQWERAGFSPTPGILVTLFNVGYEKSFPKPNPALGGAYVSVGGQSYTYGQLGQLFYDSNELQTELPK